MTSVKKAFLGEKKSLGVLVRFILSASYRTRRQGQSQAPQVAAAGTDVKGCRQVQGESVGVEGLASIRSEERYAPKHPQPPSQSLIKVGQFEQKQVGLEPLVSPPVHQQEGFTGGGKSLSAFVLIGQALVSGQEGEEDAGHLALSCAPGVCTALHLSEAHMQTSAPASPLSYSVVASLSFIFEVLCKVSPP